MSRAFPKTETCSLSGVRAPMATTVGATPPHVPPPERAAPGAASGVFDMSALRIRQERRRLAQARAAEAPGAEAALRDALCRLDMIQSQLAMGDPLHEILLEVADAKTAIRKALGGAAAIDALTLGEPTDSRRDGDGFGQIAPAGDERS